ncbi:MAG: type I-E CRISPR-associated protein Cse2/CasB [Enterovibrio sp.]
MSSNQSLAQSRAAFFVTEICKRCQNNKGLAARLRRADNPATEYQCWETLAQFNVNLEFADRRLPYALIAASIARSKQAANGDLPFGRAIAQSFSDGSGSDQAIARLRRVLACSDIVELCQILRPLLTLIQSRITQQIDFASLLQDLLWFDHNSERVKARWAQQFYGKTEQEVAEKKVNADAVC